MTDIPVQIAAPVTEAPLAEGAAALPPIVEQSDTPVGQSLLTNPVPAYPEQVSNVEQATPADWHPNDPLRRGAASGHVAIYADKQLNGLTDAKQHWDTFTALADGGKIPEVGDTAEVMRVWHKFRSDPQTLKPDESANLLNAVSQVGAATAQSPDLQFDPVGRVASVGARGEVRVVYPAKTHVSGLSLQPLAPAAVDRLRTLAHLGEGATKPAYTQDMVAPYLGLDTNHSSKDAGKIDEVIAGLADELASTPEKVRAQIAAGWDSLRTPSEPWQKPFQVGVTNPAVDALNDGLSRNLIDAMRGGVNALDFSEAGDPAVSVQPEGGLAVSAPPTERNLRLLRHLYPAFTQDGVTAWLPGNPSPTENASKLPGDVYNDFFLKANGGHPLFRPGVTIVYDATDPNHPGADLGPVLTSGPELKMTRWRAADIDPDRFDDLLKSHAWAILPGGNATRASLVKSGFNPITHKVGDTTQSVVFGITPDQARQHTDGEIVANAGTYSSDGFRPGTGVSFEKADDGQPSTTKLATGDVHWLLSGVDRSAEPTGPPGQDVATERSRRRAVTVQGDIHATVADLEGRGGQNLKVYAHQNQLDGFHTAWEHVYTDGTNTTSVLTRRPASAAHTGPVLVRSTDGLPETYSPPQTARQGSAGFVLNGVQVITPDKIRQLTDVDAAGLRLDGSAIVPTDEGGDVSLSGGRIVVKDPSPQAGRLIAAARATGLVDSDFKYDMPAPVQPGVPPSAVTISGDRVHPVKQTRPSPSWAARFGNVFDPGWREADGVKELDPKLQDHLANVYETFLGKHQVAVDLWDLQRIAVTSAYSKTPAYTEWGKLGGAVGLSAQHWKDPALLTDHVIRLQGNGTIVPNVTPTPAYFVTHELGHIVHGALQFGTDGSGAKKQILDIRKRLGRDGIVRGLSAQAWQSPEEMVAEAVSEGVLARNPRPVAREILNVITAAYDRVMAARTERTW